MATMGNYCKAYSVEKLREFSGWTENLQNLNEDRAEENGEGQSPVTELKNDDYLYLQENFVVTDGIFLDQNVIFDNVTPEWIEFCKTRLEFQVPDFDAPAAESSAAGSNGDNG